MTEAQPYRRPNGGSERVWSLSIGDIRPDPAQARRIFEPEKLSELARSIRELGVIQPLLVRKTGSCFTLIAGERRLRAAAMAGLTHVPCIISSAGEERAAYMALVENLQRRDLDCFEEARGIARLMETFGLTREQAAEKLGKSQSALANKLRLLRLSPACVAAVRRAGLTERHARALLKLPDEAAVLEAVERVGRERLSVARTEAYVEGLLTAKKEKSPLRASGGEPAAAFESELESAVKRARSKGLGAELSRLEREDAVVLTVTLKKERTA